MERLDCELALGCHEQVIGELEALIAQHPLRERLRGQYMLALYRSGRQADALRAYQDTRQTLVDRLGLEPSEALQRLERAILNHDPALELPAGIPRPAPQREEPRDRGWLRPVVLGALVVLAGLAVAVLLATRKEGARTMPPNSVAVIDPGSNEVADSVPVGVEPKAIAVGEGSVWAANTADETVSRIDSRTRRLVRTIPVGEYPSDVAVAADSAWVALGAPQQVRRIDLTRNEADEAIAWSPPTPGFVALCTRLGMSVALGAGALWIACVNRETPPISDALRIDVRTRKVTHVPDAMTVTAPVAVGAARRRVRTWVGVVRERRRELGSLGRRGDLA